jgi:carbon storage regulator
MLVLSRKKNESIMIGDAVEVVVEEIRVDKVRLGVRAPGDIGVHRKEVWDVMEKMRPPTRHPVDRFVGGEDVRWSPLIVLSRKKNESIVVNGDIFVVVVEIKGDKVRLGIESPKEIAPHRREVYEAIRRMERGEG